MKRLTLWCLMYLFCAASTQVQAYKLGVYYFPGWKAQQKGNAYPNPWELIKPYPERHPLLGWYEEDQPGVMQQQLKWMREAGLSYVVFDWLWGPDNRAYLDHGVNAYLAEQNKQGIEFSILWANHTDYIFSRTQFSALFNFWAQRYFTRPDYLKIAGKPAIFIFSAQVLANNAKKIGMSVPELLALADVYAKRAGLPGVFFVGGVAANASADFNYSAANGFSAFSFYNVHGPATKSYEPGRNLSHSFAELDMAYRDHWQWMMERTGGLYIVPITAGWDKKPWGGSKDPLHDNSRPTVAEFKTHLQAAKGILDQNPVKTQGLGVICCWNEYGEGSYIEPTKSQGSVFLEQIKQVFADQPN